MGETLRSLEGRAAKRSDIAGLDVFEGLATDVLDWIVERSTVVELAADQLFIENGDAAEEMLVMLSGEAEFAFHMMEGEISYGTIEPGEVTGVLPYSRMTTYPGRGVAVEPSLIAVLSRDALAIIILEQPMLGAKILMQLSVMLSQRLRQTSLRLVEFVDKQRELSDQVQGPSFV